MEYVKIFEILQILMFGVFINQSYTIAKKNSHKPLFVLLLKGLGGCVFITILVLISLGQRQVNPRVYEMVRVPPIEEKIDTGSRTFLILFIPYLFGIFMGRDEINAKERFKRRLEEKEGDKFIRYSVLSGDRYFKKVRRKEKAD